MMNTPVQENIRTEVKPTVLPPKKSRAAQFLCSQMGRNALLLVFTALLLFGSVIVSNNQFSAHAANPGAGNGCSWYRVHYGDTLGAIARSRHTSISTLARVNGIWNVNLIFVGQNLCIPYHIGGGSSSGGGYGPTSAGVLSNGTVRWYAYNALEWSNRAQVESILRRAASQYGLPQNLVLAIAWQESGWYQHVIARDGGIGVMQLMPYTAQGINAGTGIRRDPYRLSDNIYLGVTYLSWLWHSFHGNLYQVISAYNEGGWAVSHRGIFNWSYVNSVRYLMSRF